MFSDAAAAHDGVDGRTGSDMRESAIAAQILNLEATFDHMLQQANQSMRKDMASREERLVQRIESERKEHQAALFELRRDLSSQQTNEFAAHEDRLARRLDSERREPMAALVDLRRDVDDQQDLRVQVANLRRDLGTTQAALSKLAASWPGGGGEGGDTQLSSDGKAALESAAAATEACLADLRRELSAQREQLQLQEATADASFSAFRKELIALQGDEVRSLQEQLGRGTADLARNLQDVQRCLEREVDRLRADLEAERAQSEQRAGYLGILESRNQAALRRMDDVERRLDPNSAGEAGRSEGGLSATLVEDISTKLLKEVEHAEYRLSHQLAAKLTECHGSIGRVSQDLAKERNERCTALADISCRTDDAVALAERAERATTADVASDSVSERFGQKGFMLGGPGMPGHAEHVALAACVGELDAELRVELADRINTVVKELRQELGDNIQMVDEAIREIVSATGPVSRLEGRVRALEAARLDLRVGALESAAQHGAVFAESDALAASRAIIQSQARGGGAETPHVYVNGATMSRDLGGATGWYQHREQRQHADDLDISQPLPDNMGAPFEGDSATARLGDAEAHFGARFGARMTQQDRRQEAELADHMALSRALGGSTATGADGQQPLISNELKERLEVLVQQVKMTLGSTLEGATMHSHDSGYSGVMQGGSSYLPAGVSSLGSAPALSTTYGGISTPMHTTAMYTIPAVEESRMFYGQPEQLQQDHHSMSMSARSVIPAGYMQASCMHTAPAHVLAPIAAPTQLLAPQPVPQNRTQIGPAVLSEVRVYEPEPTDPARRRAGSPTRARASSPVALHRRSSSPMATAARGRSPSPVRGPPGQQELQSSRAALGSYLGFRQ